MLMYQTRAHNSWISLLKKGAAAERWHSCDPTGPGTSTGELLVGRADKGDNFSAVWRAGSGHRIPGFEDQLGWVFLLGETVDVIKPSQEDYKQADTWVKKQIRDSYPQ